MQLLHTLATRYGHRALRGLLAAGMVLGMAAAAGTLSSCHKEACPAYSDLHSGGKKKHKSGKGKTSLMGKGGRM